MIAQLNNCNWPPLGPLGPLGSPYAQALHDAVAFILNRFDVVAVVAAGSIIRGTPDQASDFDIFVINRQPQRQRIQRFFHGVPVEFFVNPIAAVNQYFEQEAKAAKASTAHMFATGFAVFDPEGVVAPLRQQAKALLAQAPPYAEADLTWLRYIIADRYENARDILAKQPANANMLLGVAVFDMLRYAFRKARHFIPRDKDLLAATASLDLRLADLATAFYATADIETRQHLAAQIADQTIETQGFFEWESALETIDSAT